MTDIASLMAQSGMSLEDVEILRQATGGTGMIDLGLTGSAVSPSRGGMPTNPTQTNFIAAPANYKIDPRGNRVGDTMIDAASLYGDLSGQFYDGLGPKAKGAQKAINRGISRVGGTGARRMAGRAGAALGALPGMGALGTAAKVLGPAAGALGGAVAVGDLVMGQESAANKAMDATAMTVGGILGSVGGPLGTAAGIGVGKMLSDGTQWLFGDKKTPEQRKMELALAQLQGGGAI